MTRIFLASTGLCLAAIATPAIAAPPAAAPISTAPSATMIAVPSATPSPFAAASAVPDDILSGAHAKANLSLIDQIASVQNSSNVAGNTINGDFSTGVVSIASDAFAGTTGLTMFNINTGNNVAINASMNVNVAIQP